MSSVTLQQIADEAGVTRGQVSRVLNGRYKENRPAIARKAQRIRDIAEGLGYRPNMAARSVTSGKFGQLAFVTCGDLGFDWFAPELLHGVHESVETDGQRLVIAEMSAPQLLEAGNMPRLFREASVDGLLVNLDGKLSGDVLEAFDALKLPMVLLNQKRHTRCVYPDEIAGGAEAARHLIADRRKRLAYACLTMPTLQPHYSRFDRLQGFWEAAEAAGLQPAFVLDGDESYAQRRGNGHEIVGQLLDQHASVDGIVCYSTVEALAVVLAAARRGIRVPQDLRVVVFDHQVSHAKTGIPVDTLVIPFKKVGTQAVQLLREMVRGDQAQRPPRQRIAYEQLYVADREDMRELTGRSGALR